MAHEAAYEREIRSPLTGRASVALDRTIDVDALVREYRRQLNVDVAPYFEGVPTLHVYRCLETDYRFYEPHGIEGDGAFYAALQHFAWYYQPWKWEHDVADRSVRGGDKVLEVGAGRGDFLEHVRRRGATGVGLELNPSALDAARSRGLAVVNQALREHAASNEGAYDLVCAFQVLEHVHDVADFLTQSVRALKPGGRLVVGVPNNDSYIRHLEWDVLNMPPHHQGLWNRQSLRSVARVIDGLSLDGTFIESLDANPLYVEKYQRALVQRPIVGRLMRRIPAWISHALLRRVSSRIAGDTIVAVYTRDG